MTALDAHARHLLNHYAAPLVQAIRMQPAGVAFAPLRVLPDRDRDTVIMLLAAMVPADRDPYELLSWWTAQVVPEHHDLDGEAPRPLIIGGA